MPIRYKQRKVLANLISGTVVRSNIGLLLGASGGHILPTGIRALRKYIDIFVIDDLVNNETNKDVRLHENAYDCLKNRLEEKLFPAFSVFGCGTVGALAIVSLFSDKKAYGLAWLVTNAISGVYEFGNYMARRQLGQEKRVVK